MTAASACRRARTAAAAAAAAAARGPPARSAWARPSRPRRLGSPPRRLLAAAAAAAGLPRATGAAPRPALSAGAAPLGPEPLSASLTPLSASRTPLRPSANATQKPVFTAATLAEDYVLVFTYGKVGSTSLQVSLKKAFDIEKFPFVGKPGDRPHTRGASVHYRLAATDFLAHVPQGRRCWIMCVTRNPFIEPMSWYFERILDRAKKEDFLKWDRAQLHQDFRKYLRHFGVPYSWFYRHFFPGVQVNLSAHAEEFDQKSRRLFIQTRSPRWGIDLNILLLHYEDIHHWDRIIGELIPHFKTAYMRVSEKRWYSARYEELRRTFAYPPAEFRRILRSDTWPFYSGEERKRLVAGELMRAAGAEQRP